MSKPRKRFKKRGKSLPKQRRQHRQAKRSRSAYVKDVFYRIPLIVRIFCGFLLALATACSSMVGVYDLLLTPDIVLSPPVLGADYRQPYDQPFVISNNSSLPVYDVSATCDGPSGISGVPASGEPSLDPSQSFSIGGWFKIGNNFNAAKLKRHEHREFTCGSWILTEQTGQPIIMNRASITVVVKFRTIPFIPWTITNSTYFNGELGNDWKFHWKESPLPLNAAPASSSAHKSNTLSF